MTKLAIDFLQASLLVLLAGLLLQLILALAIRRFPVLRSERSLWLGLLWLLLLMLLAPLFPLPQVTTWLPPLSLRVPADLLAAGGIELGEVQPLPVAASATPAWPVLLSVLWLGLYGLGLLVRLGRLVMAWRALRTLLQTAEARASVQGVAMRVTPAAVSPMIIGLRRPVLVWPSALDDAPASQQALVLAHELTHVQRRDPLWLLLALPPHLLLWFVPGIGRMVQALNDAIELACDRSVLCGRGAAQRREYAQAMLAQFHSSRSVLVPGFGGSGSNLERLRQVRDGHARALGMRARILITLAGAALLALGIQVPAALAWDIPTGAASTVVARDWRHPLAQSRVTSFFGVKSALVPNGHRGIDFAARTGTPVLGAASGRVLVSVDHYAARPQLGKVVILDHGGGLRSVYAHLDSRAVHEGDTVGAGQLLGRSGASGKVTGPHLHLELWQGDQPIDPETLITGLAQHASPQALAQRQSR